MNKRLDQLTMGNLVLALVLIVLAGACFLLFGGGCTVGPHGLEWWGAPKPPRNVVYTNTPWVKTNLTNPTYGIRRD